MLDIHFKNSEACQFKKIGDNIINWCLSDEGTCFKMEGIWGRLFDNAWPLFKSTVDFIKVMKTNDLCYGDNQLLAEIYQAWGDITDIAVIVHGMNVHWDENVEHIK